MAGKSFNPSIIEECMGAISIAGSILLSPLLRPWYSKWGASESEVNMSLPGDKLAPDPKLESTRAVKIKAPAHVVWPWLLQLGQGRGVFYSYIRLENLAGCEISNADRIFPEFQDLKVGDQVRLGPEGYPAFDVAAVEPVSTLILRGDIPPGVEPKTGIWIWNFVLVPINEKTTRLILRTRLNYESNLGNTLMWRVFIDPISFNMERKMMQGIKVRAESAVFS